MPIVKPGRKIHTNRKPRYCPFCGGSTVKAGTLRGRQLWLCHLCKRRTGHPDMVPVNVENK